MLCQLRDSPIKVLAEAQGKTRRNTSTLDTVTLWPSRSRGSTTPRNPAKQAPDPATSKLGFTNEGEENREYAVGAGQPSTTTQATSNTSTSSSLDKVVVPSLVKNHTCRSLGWCPPVQGREPAVPWEGRLLVSQDTCEVKKLPRGYLTQEPFLGTVPASLRVGRPCGGRGPLVWSGAATPLPLQPLTLFGGPARDTASGTASCAEAHSRAKIKAPGADSWPPKPPQSCCTFRNDTLKATLQQNVVAGGKKKRQSKVLPCVFAGSDVSATPQRLWPGAQWTAAAQGPWGQHQMYGVREEGQLSNFKMSVARCSMRSTPQIPVPATRRKGNQGGNPRKNNQEEEASREGQSG